LFVLKIIQEKAKKIWKNPKVCKSQLATTRKLQRAPIFYASNTPQWSHGELTR